ncbi:MAG TPA: sigma-70 family RNA polymerase sigma factor, partial [Thermoanaerobaculia bacterium]
MTTSVRSAAALLPAVAGGDLGAFEALYDRYSGLLFGLLLRILGNQEDAQEVLQETFVKIWSSARMFDAVRGSEVSWLVSIARSRAIDRLRSRRLRSDRENDAGRELAHRASFIASPSGDEDAIRSEAQVAVRGALAELPESQRV